MNHSKVDTKVTISIVVLIGIFILGIFGYMMINRFFDATEQIHFATEKGVEIAEKLADEQVGHNVERVKEGADYLGEKWEEATERKLDINFSINRSEGEDGR